MNYFEPQTNSEESISPNAFRDISRYLNASSSNIQPDLESHGYQELRIEGINDSMLDMRVHDDYSYQHRRVLLFPDSPYEEEKEEDSRINRLQESFRVNIAPRVYMVREIQEEMEDDIFDDLFTEWYTQNNPVYYPKKMEDPIIYHYEPIYLNATSCDCAICLGTHDICDMVRPECGHYFGKSCFETWISKQKNCPLCRSNVLHVAKFQNK